MRRKHNFITGAIILAISGVTAKFLGLFFRWPVTMLIGDEGIGLYQMAYPIYMFIIGIMSGFPVAISSMVSQRVALGKPMQAHRVFKTSLYILVLIGVVSSIMLYLGAPYLINILKWRKDSYYALTAIAFAPAFVGIMNSYRGYFQGLQMMTMPALSQLVEQLGRVIVGVGLTYMLLPLGVTYGAAGASFGASAGAVLGCILLASAYITKRKSIIQGSPEEENESGIGIAKALLSSAIPISLGMTVSSIMSLIDSIVVPSQLLTAGFGEKMATELYGQLAGKAHVIINVPFTLSAALGTSLVPAIAEVKALRNVKKVTSRAESAVKIAMLLGLPSTAGLFIMSDPILHLVFPGKSQGASVLQILSLSVLFIVLGQILVSLLHGVGDVMSPVKNLVIGGVFKLVLCYIMTGMPMLNVKGAAISSIVGNMIAAGLNFRDAARYTYLSFDIDKMFLRPLLSTIVMGVAVSVSYREFIYLTGSNGISTILSVLAGIIVYVLMILVTGCISFRDIMDYIKYRKKVTK